MSSIETVAIKKVGEKFKLIDETFYLGQSLTRVCSNKTKVKGVLVCQWDNLAEVEKLSKIVSEPIDEVKRLAEAKQLITVSWSGYRKLKDLGFFSKMRGRSQISPSFFDLANNIWVKYTHSNWKNFQVLGS